ncbi:uncharacterized protein [Clytia hemisphaerica]|uniref:Actin n=1 Tax=Clytia hemisphaerica TaxID=252671 RepID=A0A7M5X982_9CNID
MGQKCTAPQILQDDEVFKNNSKQNKTGFYLTNRNRRKSSTSDQTKDEKRRRRKSSAKETQDGVTLNGSVRKRTGEKSNGNTETLTVSPSTDQDEFVLQTFCKSPLTPHKRLSIHHGHDDFAFDRPQDKDDGKIRHVDFDAISIAKVTEEQYAESLDENRNSEKMKDVTMGQGHGKEDQLAENEPKTVENELRTAGNELRTAKNEEAKLYKDVDASEIIFEEDSQSKDESKSENSEVLVKVNEFVESNENKIDEKERQIVETGIVESVTENVNREPPAKRLSKFKLFVFQEYADRMSDRILSNTSTTLDQFHDSQVDFAEDLSLTVLYEARKEVYNNTSTSTQANDEENNNNESTLDMIADKLVDQILFGKTSPQNKLASTATIEKPPEPSEKAAIPSDSTISVENDNKLDVEDGAIKTDYGRPLSGYAKNLADFLADDDEFELSDAEDEDAKEEIARPRSVGARPSREGARDSQEESDYEDTEDDEDELSDDEDESFLDEENVSFENDDERTTIFVNADFVDDEVAKKEKLETKEFETQKLQEPLETSAVEKQEPEIKIETENKKAKTSQYAPAVKRRQNNRRTRGERPKSLYEQDLQEIFNEIKMPADEDGGNDDQDDSKEVLEDGIKPVSETMNFLENHIEAKRNMMKRNEEEEEEYLMMDEDEHVSNNSSDLLGCQKTKKVSQQKPPVLGRAAVIDFGCGALKAGLSGDIRPSCYCPSVIGVPRRFSQDVSKMKKGFYVGDEAWEIAGMLQIEHPIKQEINNWSDIGNIFEYLYDEELKINSNEHPMLLTEPGLTSSTHREKLIEVIFERFSAPSLMLANQSCLALYSKGLVTGLSLNSGFYFTQSTPIYEGHALPYATTQLDIGGDTITNYLNRNIMSTQGHQFNTSSEKLLLNSMKQDLCYVALDPSSEEEKYRDHPDKMNESFALPDGQEITIGLERFSTPEIMFDPLLIGIRNQLNVVDTVLESCSRVDEDLRDILFENILVSGGNSKLKGFNQRLEHELKKQPTDYRITALKYADNALLSTWVGGSVLASIAGYRDQWISMDLYAEYGANIVHKMCF